MLSDNTVILASEDLTLADLEGEAVILDGSTGRYYGLNTVASRILELVQQPKAVREIVSTLHQEYEVDRERLEKDVLRFLKEMVDAQLVQVSDEAAV